MKGATCAGVHPKAAAGLIILAVAAARAMDAWMTYQITPDLANEQNVVHVLADVGWQGLLWINAIAVLGTSLCVWYVWTHRHLVPRQRGLDAKGFAALYYFGEPRPMRDMMWYFPKGWRRHVMVYGAILPIVLIAISILITASHLGALRWGTYAAYHNAVVTRWWAQLFVVWLVTGLSARLAWTLEWQAYQRHWRKKPVRQ